MNKMTMKEANRNFSQLAKLVDDEGAVIITKHGKERYVMMTTDVYEGKSAFEAKMIREAEKGLWVDLTKQVHDNMLEDGFEETGRTIAKITLAEGKCHVLDLHFFEGEDYPESAGELTVPAESVSFIEGESLEIHSDEEKNIKYISAYMRYEPADAFEKLVHTKVKEAMEELKQRSEPIPEAILTGSRFFSV